MPLLLANHQMPSGGKNSSPLARPTCPSRLKGSACFEETFETVPHNGRSREGSRAFSSSLTPALPERGYKREGGPPPPRYFRRVCRSVMRLSALGGSRPVPLLPLLVALAWAGATGSSAARIFPRLRAASRPDPASLYASREYRTCYVAQKVRGAAAAGAALRLLFPRGVRVFKLTLVAQ